MISRLGSSSLSMYTFRLLLATDLTALMSFRDSSVFRILLICGGGARAGPNSGRVQRAVRSRSKGAGALYASARGRRGARLRLLQVALHLQVLRP